MQRIVRPHAVVRVEREPTLVNGVPRDGEALQSSAGHRDQVLLQRFDAEGVGHLELASLAVRPFGLDQEEPVAAEEARRHAFVLEDGVAEVAQHGLVGRRLHRQIVMRAAPSLELTRVALSAARATDEIRRGNLGRRLVAAARAQEGYGRDEDRLRRALLPAHAATISS